MEEIVTEKYVRKENWSGRNEAPSKCLDINFTRNTGARKKFPRNICPPGLIFLGTFVHLRKFPSNICHLDTILPGHIYHLHA